MRNYGLFLKFVQYINIWSIAVYHWTLKGLYELLYFLLIFFIKWMRMHSLGLLYWIVQKMDSCDDIFKGMICFHSYKDKNNT